MFDASESILFGPIFFCFPPHPSVCVVSNTCCLRFTSNSFCSRVRYIFDSFHMCHVLSEKVVSTETETYLTNPVIQQMPPIRSAILAYKGFPDRNVCRKPPFHSKSRLDEKTLSFFLEEAPLEKRKHFNVYPCGWLSDIHKTIRTNKTLTTSVSPSRNVSFSVGLSIG